MAGNQKGCDRANLLRRDREEEMKDQAVTLKIVPYVQIECKFWITDDGWNGISEAPSITVQAGSFAQAKSDMEFALGRHVKLLLLPARNKSEGVA